MEKPAPLLRRSFARVLPLCMIIVVVLLGAYGVIRISQLSRDAGLGKAALTPGVAAGVPLTSEELKTRLDDLKWLLTAIISVASLFAILQAAASFFNAQGFSKQADDSITRIEKLSNEAQERYPLVAEAERAREEARRTIRTLQFEECDWRDGVYQSKDMSERQRILSADRHLSADLVPGKIEDTAFLRGLASFYASKWMYERGKHGACFADLERATYYLELARKNAQNDFYLLNDLGVLQMEYYRLIDPSNQALAKARDFFRRSLKQYKTQQRGYYNLAVADGYQGKWEDAESNLTKALKEQAWELTPLPERECIIHYNLACARARISYLQHSAGREPMMNQSLEALREAAKLGLMRKDTVDNDIDKPDGDLYRMAHEGPQEIAKRLTGLRPRLWRNRA